MGETTNDLQQSLVDTMDLISSKIARGTGAPHTIKAEIIEELDSGVHQYSISYGGAVYKDAYAIGNVTYDPSTIVYVLIPENDFDNEKVILNAVVPSASDYEDEELTELKVPINDDLLAQFNISLDLQSWADQEYPVINLTPASGDNTFNKTFKDYSNTYKMFSFEASVKTEIDEDHRTKGNYGLKLTLPFVQRDESNSTGQKKITKDFYMDVTNLLGNPYEYNIYQKTILYFTIDEALEYDIDGVATITPFTKDFGYITNPEGIESDIHFRNVGIRMIDVVPIEQIKGHYLTIESNHGYYFLETKSTSYKEPKTLTPVLRINGKKTNYSSYDCYWFVEDASINALSKEYTTLGGSSWRCLNKKVNVTTDDTGKETFEYKTNDYQLVINPDDVVSSLRYKCILVKQQYSASSIVTIKNLNDPILFSLESKTGSNTYVEKVGNVELRAKLIDPNESDIETKSYSVSWQRYDKDGLLKSEDFYTLDNEETIYPYNTETEPNHRDTEYYQDISFPCSLIEKSNTIYCTFYMDYTIKKVNEAKEIEIEFIHKMIGTVSLFINTISGLKYAVSIVGGDKLYKYDSQGNSPMIANYDGAPTSKGKACNPLKFRVYRTEDGKELTESEYLYTTYKWTFPKKNTMLELVKPKEGSTNPVLTDDDDYYYIEGRQGNGYNLQYKIKETYRQSYTNNIIRLSVTINGEDAGTDATTITFTKDGMGGTNGSRYTAFIINNNHAYNEIDEDTGELRKAQVIYAANPSGDYLAGWYKYEIGEKEINLETGKAEQKKPQPMGTSNGIPFQLKLYKDSTPIESLSPVEGSNVSISVEWSMFDPWETHTFFQMDRGDNNLSAIMNVRKIPTDPNANDKWINTWNNSNDKICNIVQAVVTITDLTITTANGDRSLMEEVLYVYYPIEAIRAEKAGMIFNGIIPTLKGGFSEVLYNSGGTNPIWDESNKNIYCIDSVYQDNKVDLHYDWEVSSNLIYKDIEETIDEKKIIVPNGKAIIPITKFEHDITNNYVKVELDLTKDKKDDLEERLTALKNSSNTYNEKIKELKNFKQSLLDMIQNIGYNRYINIDSKKCLKGCIDLLKIRFQLLTTLDSLKLKLNDLRLLEDTLRIELKNAGKPVTSSPIDSDNSLLTKINTTYRHIYLLDGNTNKIEDVDFTIRIPNASSYYNSFIYSWNGLATKYRNIVNNNYLVWVRNKPNEVNDQYDNLNNLRISITNLVPYCFDIKENLDYAHQGLLAYTTDQQFINLKQQVSNLTNKVTDVENGGICSYTDFEKLLADLTSLVSKYNTNAIFEDPDEKILESTDYTRNICDKAIDENRSALADITSEMDSINVSLKAGPNLIYLKPIIMHMDNTGMSYLRGWDGHKLYKGAHGENGSGDEYYYAPEIGAGAMEDGLFTGILMAAKTSNGSTDKPNIGLFGMNKSIQTMFLNAQDGSAIFGASGSGQIIIDPSQNMGLIYSSAYFNTGSSNDYKSDGKPSNSNYNRIGSGDKGMLICLGGTTKDKDGKDVNINPFIHFGDSTGYIYSGKHNSLINKEDGFYLNQDGLSIGSKTYIDKTGTLRLGKGATTYDPGLDPKNPKPFYFWTISEGERNSYERHSTENPEDKIPYSYIGYNANELCYSADPLPPEYEYIFGNAKDNSVYIGTDGMRLGKKFAVDMEGNFYAKDGYLEGTINAKQGYIGGWTISETEIQSIGTPNVTLKSDGTIFTSNYNNDPKKGAYRGWKFFSNGNIVVHGAPGAGSGSGDESIFGGVHKDGTGTFYESGYNPNPNSESDGIFRYNCFQEIKGISHLAEVCNGVDDKGKPNGTNKIGYVWLP